MESSDDVFPIPLDNADDFPGRQNVGTPLPLFVVGVGDVVVIVAVVLVVDNCKPVDLAPPLGLGQELHSHLISVDGSVAKQSSRDQDVLVVAVFESGFCAAINKSSEQQVF